MTRLIVAIPLVLFLGLAAVFAFRVTDGADRSVVPSALIGKPVPAMAMPALEAGLPGFDPAALEGRVSLVNIWASWCAPCRVEHPLLMELSGTPGLQLVGINYKDRMPSAKAFLADLGNPYDAIGVDADGRRGIEWGVYGVPETFLVGPEGTILAKHVGPLTPEALEGEFGEKMRALLAEHAPGS